MVEDRRDNKRPQRAPNAPDREPSPSVAGETPNGELPDIEVFPWDIEPLDVPSSLEPKPASPPAGAQGRPKPAARAKAASTRPDMPDIEWPVDVPTLENGVVEPIVEARPTREPERPAPPPPPPVTSRTPSEPPAPPAPEKAEVEDDSLNLEDMDREEEQLVDLSDLPSFWEMENSKDELPRTERETALSRPRPASPEPEIPELHLVEDGASEDELEGEQPYAEEQDLADAVIRPEPVVRRDGGKGRRSSGGEAEREEKSRKENEEAKEDENDEEVVLEFAGGWVVRRPGRYQPFAFDDGQARILFQGARISPLENLDDAGGYLHYLADFPEAQSLGLLDVNSAQKYAPVMARKRLEEQGLLSSDGYFHSYYMHRKSRNEVSVFYQVLPRLRWEQLNRSYRQYPAGFILYDCLGLLYGALQSMGGRRSHALAMHLGESILLLVGRGKEVYIARRYAMFGDSRAALNEGVQSIRRDIELSQRNLAGEIDVIHWIEPLTRNLAWQPPPGGVPVKPMPLARMRMGDAEIYSALPPLFNKISPEAALGPKEERWLRPLELAEKWLWIGLALIILAAGGGGLLLKENLRLANDRLDMLALQSEAVEARMPKLPDYGTEGLQPALNLAHSLDAAAHSPTMSELWNRVSSAKNQDIRVNRFDIYYDAAVPTNPQVVLEGEIELPLTESQQAYNAFLNRLETQGFMVEGQNLQLDLAGNVYEIHLRYAPVGGQGGA